MLNAYTHASLKRDSIFKYKRHRLYYMVVMQFHHVLLTFFIDKVKIYIITLYFYHIYVVILFAQLTHVGRPTNITIIQCELYMYILGFNIAWRGMVSLLRNSAIFVVPSYFLGTDDDGTSRSFCIIQIFRVDKELFKQNH